MSSRRGHNEGSIHKREEDGQWVGAVSLQDGKRKWFYGKTRREVQENLKAALHAQQDGTLVTGPSQSMSQYLNRWLEDTVKHSVRPRRTYVCYELNSRRLSRMWAGHSTITLTLDTYSHVTPALHADVATKMNRLFEAMAEAV